MRLQEPGLSRLCSPHPQAWAPFFLTADPHPVTALGNVHSRLVHFQDGSKAALASWEGLCFRSWFVVFSSSRRSLPHRRLLGWLHRQKRAPCSAGPGPHGSPGCTVLLLPLQAGRRRPASSLVIDQTGAELRPLHTCPGKQLMALRPAHLLDQMEPSPAC